MKISTVCGDIDAQDLGRTLMHEHIFVAMPGSHFDPAMVYDRSGIIAEASRRLTQLRVEHGVRTLVDPCPIEVGRDPALMAEVSQRSGVHIICATGFYYEEAGIPYYWRHRSVDEIARFYVDEITRGIAGTGIRAGILKVSTGAPAITELETRFVQAASIAHRATGVPILTHTERGQCGPEQQQLFRRFGVDACRCLIGHSCGNADPAYHRRIVDGGSYIGFDRIGIVRNQPDEVRADNVARLIREGFVAQVMISQDAYCAWQGKQVRPLAPGEAEAIARGLKDHSWPRPMTHLFTHFLPMLAERGIGEEHFSTMLQANPLRYFRGEPLPERSPS